MTHRRSRTKDETQLCLDFEPVVDATVTPEVDAARRFRRTLGLPASLTERSILIRARAALVQDGQRVTQAPVQHRRAS
jgi:hypothetical protein